MKIYKILSVITLVSFLSHTPAFAESTEVSNLDISMLQEISQVQVLQNQELKIEKKVSPIDVTYKVVTSKNGKFKATAVYLKGKEIVRYTAPAGGFTPEQRAKILVSRLESYLSQNGSARNIKVAMRKKNLIGIAGKEDLFTVDHKMAKSYGMSQHELAFKTVNNIRTALGAQKIKRDYTLLASRGNVSMSFARDFLGREEVGVASWYGGRFHGRRAADGSRFSKYEFTAAHKTLPFGSLVKVTNLKNGKECVVKINDRGPFIAGRIIDLSREAAKSIGMSGIAKVKIETIGKYQ